MKLELFSGEEKKQTYVDRLKRIFALDETKLEAFVLALARGALSSPKGVAKDDMTKLKTDFAAAEELVRTMIWTMLEVVLRAYAGKLVESAQDEMVRLGFSERGVRALPEILERLPQEEKNALKFWAIEAEAVGDRNHLHAISSESDTRTVIDNGSLVSVLPISVVRIRVKARDVREEQNWRLELTCSELEFLVHNLDLAKKELDLSTQDLKKRLGDFVITPA
jgi:hypothetical protein